MIRCSVGWVCSAGAGHMEGLVLFGDTSFIAKKPRQKFS